MKEGKNGHQSWFQCWSSRWDVRVLEHAFSLGVGVPFYRQVSHFLCKLVPCRLFFQTFLEVDPRGLWGLGWSWSSPTVCAPFGASSLLLCCTVLYLSAGKVVPCSHMAPCSSHILLFLMACYYQQFLSVIANNPWLAAQPSGYRVWDMHTSPLSSGILQGGTAQRWKVEQTYWKPEQDGKNEVQTLTTQ